MKAFVVCLGLAACGAPARPVTVTVPPPESSAAVPVTPVAAAPTEDERSSTIAPEIFASGKVTLVHFFASWCAPCAKSMPELDALYKKHGGRVAVVAIGEDDDESDMRAYVSQLGVMFTVLFDAAKAKATRWRPQTMPTTFVVDARGGVRFTHAGYRDGDADTLEAEVTRLLAER